MQYHTRKLGLDPLRLRQNSKLQVYIRLDQDIDNGSAKFDSFPPFISDGRRSMYAKIAIFQIKHGLASTSIIYSNISAISN